MKNLKKLLSVLVVIAIVATTAIVPVFAAEALSDDAIICKDLGVLKGGNDGVTAAYTQTQPDRVQAALMFLRLKGLGDTAETYAATENFSDVSKHWGKSITGYLYDNPSLGWVGSAGKFMPNDKITAQQYYKVMLVALGYVESQDFQYANVMSFAAKKGLSALSDVGANAVITVDQMATATVEALKATVNKGTKTLLAKLVEDDKAIDAKVAEATGFYTAPPVVAPALTAEVTAINGKQVVVVFSKAINKDTIKADNIKVYKNAGSTTSTWNYTLSSDNKTVTIGLTADNFTQDSKVKVVIENVKTADKAETIAKTEKTVVMRDTVSPEILSAEFTSSKTVKIKVSEPIALGTGADALHVMNNVLFDGLKLVGSITEDFDNNEIYVTLGAKLAVGEHKIKVTGYRDYSDWLAADKEVTASIVADTTAPSITAVEAGRAYVKVTFDEPVSSIGTLTINGHDYTAGTTSDNKTFKITLAAGYELGLGSIVADKIVYYGTTDMEGNTISSSAKKEFAFTAISETDAPTATITLDSSNNVIITFSEEMSVPGKLKITKADGTAVVSDVVPEIKDATIYQYKVTATNAKLNAVTTATTYNFELKDAKDGSVRQNAIATTTVSLEAKDIVAPQVLKAILTQAHTTIVVDSVTKEDKKAQITVFFTEAMDAATITDLNNYTVSIDGAETPRNLSSISGVTAAAASDNKSVVITFPGTGTNAVNAGATINTDLYVLLVKDAAGKVLTTTPTAPNLGFNQKVDVAAAATDLQLAVIGGTAAYAGVPVAMIDTNKIKVGFSNPIAVVDPSDFVVFTNGEGALAAQTVKLVGVAYELSSDAKVVTITLSGNLTKDAMVASTDGGNADLYVKVGSTKDIYGNKVQALTTLQEATAANASALGNINDYLAPTLTKVEKGTVPNTIKFTFSEKVNEAVGGNFLAALLVKDSSGSVIGMGTTLATGVAGLGTAELVVTFDKTVGAYTAIGQGEKTIKVSFPAAIGIRDLAANALAPVADTDTKVVVDSVAPTAAVTTTSATGLVLTFNEALYNSGVAIADGADVKGLFIYDGTAGNYTSATYNATAKTVTFVITGEEGKKLTIAGTVTDQVLNAIAGGSYDVATFTAATNTWALD